MYDAVLSLTESAVYRYSCSGAVPGPTGNGHPQIAPFDIFPTADGNCGICAPGEMFRKLCELMDRPELADDERFATFGDRLVNRPALNAEIVAWTSARSTADIVALLGGVVPVGPVNDMAAIWSDPHVAARGMLVTVEQPDGSRPVTLAGQPIKMSKSGTGVRTRPPRLNEHAHAILAEAGLDP
jgi:crotonobetainyl-CoA:carnitine CoA-transferase CaiB-like acyl-CoA transferase